MPRLSKSSGPGSLGPAQRVKSPESKLRATDWVNGKMFHLPCQVILVGQQSIAFHEFMCNYSGRIAHLRVKYICICMKKQIFAKMPHAARTLSTLSLPSSCFLLQGHLAYSSKHATVTASWVAILHFNHLIDPDLSRAMEQTWRQISFATQSSALPRTWHTVSTSRQIHEKQRLYTIVIYCDHPSVSVNSFVFTCS